MKRLAVIVLLACASAQAADMIEIRYQDQDAGDPPYETRVLVTDKYLRIDDGSDNGDYVFMDRRHPVVYNVLLSQNLVMRMPNRMVPAVDGQKLGVREKILPVRQGTVRVQVFADDKLCSESVVAEKLQPKAAKAMAEYLSALAYVQWVTYQNTPEDIRSACDLAHNIYETGRALAHGLPMEERDYAGRTRKFVSSSLKPLKNELFVLPKGYPMTEPPGMSAAKTDDKRQPDSVQVK